jgi:hypothetical protein
MEPLTAEARDAALAHYREHGYARLGVMAPESVLAPLRARIDAIMLGDVANEQFFFQHDTDTGKYEDLTFGQGYQGRSLRYRKIEKLEKDPLFFDYLQHAAFAPLVRAVTGPEVSIYRALVFNKAAETGGSTLPWHQDGGLFWGVDRDPELQLWTALDDVPLGGGCIEVLPGSHKGGLVRPIGGVVPAEAALAAEAETRAVPLPAKAGEVILIHNQMWHRSRRSTSGLPRRALTVCYLPAATRCTRTKRAPREFTRVFEQIRGS